MRNIVFYLSLIISLAAIISCSRKETAVEVVNKPDTTVKDDYYTFTRKPLKQYPLVQLPLGNIQAKGWLKTQLERMNDGYTGHLYEISF